MSDTNDHSTAPNVSGGQGRAAVAACKGWNDLHEWHLYTYIASCLLRGIFPHPTPFHFNDFPPLSISFPYVQLFLTVHALSLSLSLSPSSSSNHSLTLSCIWKSSLSLTLVSPHTFFSRISIPHNSVFLSLCLSFFMSFLLYLSLSFSHPQLFLSLDGLSQKLWI